MTAFASCQGPVYADDLSVCTPRQTCRALVIIGSQLEEDAMLTALNILSLCRSVTAAAFKNSFLSAGEIVEPENTLDLH